MKNETDSDTPKQDFSQEELASRLTPEQFQITQQCGTEPPFSGKYVHEKTPGTYACIVCDSPLFDSDTKFDSGTGWPSFYDVIESGRVKAVEDRSHGMLRTEVRCANCNAHLGHVFPDGPNPTGQRYCINSGAINLHPMDESSK